MSPRHYDPQIREEDLQAYVDGRLDAHLRPDIEAFLALHPVEGERINAYRAQNVALHQAFDIVTREPLPMSVEDLADKLAQIRPETVTRRVSRYAAPAAAVVAAGVFGWFANDHWSSRGVPATSPDMAAMAPVAAAPVPAPAQAIAAAVPMAPVQQKGAAAGDTLVGWLLQQAPSSFRTAPDLQSLGLALAGGRILQDSNRLVVQLVYQGAGRMLSLYVCASPKGSGVVTPTVAGKAGLSSLYWRQGGLEFTLVGPLPDQQLLGIAQFIQAQNGAPVEQPDGATEQLRSISGGSPLDTTAPPPPVVVKPAPAMVPAPAVPAAEEVEPEIGEPPVMDGRLGGRRMGAAAMRYA